MPGGQLHLVATTADALWFSAKPFVAQAADVIIAKAVGFFPQDSHVLNKFHFVGHLTRAVER